MAQAKTQIMLQGGLGLFPDDLADDGRHATHNGRALGISAAFAPRHVRCTFTVIVNEALVRQAFPGPPAVCRLRTCQ
jgi:hypothetical protein